MPKETFTIKTQNGSVHIVRIGNKATITEERTCFGFKEKSVTEITRIDDSCTHYAFNTESQIRETVKNN